MAREMCRGCNTKVDVDNLEVHHAGVSGTNSVLTTELHVKVGCERYGSEEILVVPFQRIIHDGSIKGVNIGVTSELESGGHTNCMRKAIDDMVAQDCALLPSVFR